MSSRLAGFSLVEAALSLAILSFAIVAMIGLFPVALRTAKESSAETRATLIARRIVDEIQSFPPTNISLLRGPSLTNASARIFGLDLSKASSSVLLYDEQGEGMTNQVAVQDFSDGINAPNAYFVAEVRLTPDFPRPGIAHVQAIIEAPASAPSSRRLSFVFVTYMVSVR
jgi:type II secretory pathway pseudopilin PulG